MEKILKKECKAYVFSLEKGSQGRYHYQCVVHLLNRTRNPKTQFIKHIGKSNIPYWEFSPCSNIRALKEYCAKDPLSEVCRFTSETLALPIFDQIQLRHAQLGMLEVLEEQSDDRSIFVFSDTRGNLGKTTFIKYLMMKDGVGCVFAPTTGTLDSASSSVVRQLQAYNLDPGIQRIYLTFDITRTSPYLKNLEKKVQLLSLCEHAVSGLLSCAFQGATRNYYAKSGKTVPVIFTNASTKKFEDCISPDRECFYSYNYIKKEWYKD